MHALHRAYRPWVQVKLGCGGSCLVPSSKTLVLPCQPTHPHAQMCSHHMLDFGCLKLYQNSGLIRKFTLQTRLAHRYSSYLLYLGLSKAVSSADVPCANGGGKLISKVCMPEAYSTVTLWCVANTGPPRSQWICGHWMSIQCWSVCHLR